MEGYKESYFGWVPVDWNVYVFKECISGFSSGSTPSRTVPEYFNGNINWITSGELNYNIIVDTKEKVTQTAIKDSNLKLIPIGTFLIAITGLEAEKVRGACGIVGKESVTNQSCMALYPKKDVLNVQYLFYFYSHFGEKLAFRYCQGTKQQSYNAELVKILPIIYPPLHEQKAIADCLLTWDKAITLQTQLIKEKQLRKTALMQQLLTGKKRLRGFTEEWEKEGAGAIFKSVSIKGETNEVLLSSTQDKGIIPRSMLEARVTMPTSGVEGFKLVEKGDFVISLRSFQGGIEYSNYTGLVSPAYTVLKPKKPIVEEFYRQYFKSFEFIGRLAIAVVGIRDGKQISYDDFCTIKIPYPDFNTQSAIANILQTADLEIDLEQQKLNGLTQQKKALMQQLLTGKVRLVS